MVNRIADDTVSIGAALRKIEADRLAYLNPKLEYTGDESATSFIWRLIKDGEFTNELWHASDAERSNDDFYADRTSVRQFIEWLDVQSPKGVKDYSVSAFSRGSGTGGRVTNLKQAFSRLRVRGRI